MGKIHFDSLVIETTRRCNMRCAHCMRGEPQDSDINNDVLDSLFSKTGSVGVLTFTGGEPTMNIDAIEQTLYCCKYYNVPIQGVNIVINGKRVPNRFLKTMLDWCLYCIECGGERDMCTIAVSQDKFHEEIPERNIEKLRALSFFYPTKKRVSPQKWDTPPVIDCGRARRLDMPKSAPFDNGPVVVKKDGDDLYVHNAAITVTVHGDILKHCDYEYENIEPIRLCSYRDVFTTFEQLAVLKEDK